MILHVKGYKGIYEVSSDGVVWSLNYNREKRRARLVGQTDKNGYKVVFLNHKGVRRVLKVHRLVAQAFIPNSRRRPEVNHKDGNKENNNVDNLEWVTTKENVLHNYRVLGRQNVRGSAHKLSKLTEKQVIEIYKLKGKCSTDDIIKKYGVSQQNISLIQTGKRWKWLTKRKEVLHGV